MRRCPWSSVPFQTKTCAPAPRLSDRARVRTTCPPETTDTVTTTTVVDYASFIVAFHLVSSAQAVGALQLAVDYSDAPGGFAGSGAAVVCTNKVSGALFAPNDNEATRQLKFGIVSLTDIHAPTDLVECTFQPDGSGTPVAADFAVTVEDATTGDGDETTAVISVTVQPAP